MKRHAEKPLLVLLVLSCLLLLLPLASAVPTPRSLRLVGRSQLQQRPPALKLTSAQETAIAAAMNMGKPMARMVVEVNDYQPSGPNNRHDPPKGPGRA
ncbi:hypothetical protein BDA96_09G187500 [Sorghum bicolor]|uniref:Uncharacterized protein n=1 Tax=Sorghum bicolor TaxID=4558 RepID=A0A921U5J3_SORBI|nr:hypothetical protein BDA96_09G187500 [Sorghum bicolor]